MSDRSKHLVTKTDLQDIDLLRQAARALGLQLRGHARATLRSADLAGSAHLDLGTGVLSAPTEWAPMITKLRRQYTEERFRKDAAREGVQILRRTIREDGSIVLQCRMRGPG